MKYVFKLYTAALLLILALPAYSQEILVLTQAMTKYEPVGTFEIVIDFEVVNVSPDTQIVFEVRTINDLPQGWLSSLCFGQYCFQSEIDSIATTPPAFPQPPLAPGDTLETSIHVYTDQVSIATAYVQIQVGTFSNPSNRYILDFKATTDPTVNVDDKNILNTYNLYQNYPNPFNPSTKINYNIGEPGLVQLKVYNVLGVEVAALVNEYKNSGVYSVDFNASDFSSGVYFYSLSVNNFTQTRKMILEK
jgi:hypothetical protein